MTPTPVSLPAWGSLLPLWGFLASLLTAAAYGAWSAHRRKRAAERWRQADERLTRQRLLRSQITVYEMVDGHEHNRRPAFPAEYRAWRRFQGTLDRTVTETAGKFAILGAACSKASEAGAKFVATDRR